MFNHGDSQALQVAMALILVLLLVVWHLYRRFSFVVAKAGRLANGRETE